MSWRSRRAGSAPPDPAAPADQPEPGASAAKRRSGPPPENAGWTIFSYLISGMLVYGLLGWLLATLTQIRLLIPLGALLGLVIAVGGIVYKYGRS
jgi:F0F1-type ATP synthase assembly protein I